VARGEESYFIGLLARDVESGKEQRAARIESKSRYEKNKRNSRRSNILVSSKAASKLAPSVIVGCPLGSSHLLSLVTALFIQLHCATVSFENKTSSMLKIVI